MMRFYGSMTQAQIGAQLGMSQMHVSRLQARALTFLPGSATSGSCGSGRWQHEGGPFLVAAP
jgi:hypothetical protein